MTNTPRHTTEESKAEPSPVVTRNKSLFSKIIGFILRGDYLTRESFLAHFPFIGFVAALFMLHITVIYFYENTERNKIRVQRQLHEMNAAYSTAMSKLEREKKHSRVSEKLDETGLKGSDKSLHLIEVEPHFLDSKK